MKAQHQSFQQSMALIGNKRLIINGMNSSQTIFMQSSPAIAPHQLGSSPIAKTE
jgi:hypothetical protein